MDSSSNMTRKEEIEFAAKRRADQYEYGVWWNDCYNSFIKGAEWADKTNNIVKLFGKKLKIVIDNHYVYDRCTLCVLMPICCKLRTSNAPCDLPNGLSNRHFEFAELWQL